MLALCSFLWGLTFVAQATGAEHFSPMWFTCLRNVLAVIVLLPFIILSDKRRERAGKYVPLKKEEKRRFFIDAAVCGFSLCVASFLQQLGITLGTAPGKAGFITALYIVLTPIFSIFLKKRPSLIIWLCAFASVAGLFLLCVKEDMGIKGSDFIVLACAFAFTVQILAIDKISPSFDGVKLACGQFFFCALFSFFYAVIFEDLYTLQITGQKRLENPTVASMIMSFESVFGAISSAIILHQTMTGREIAGCAIMFSAIIVSQLPVSNRSVGKKTADADEKEESA